MSFGGVDPCELVGSGRLAGILGVETYQNFMTSADEIYHVRLLMNLMCQRDAFCRIHNGKEKMVLEKCEFLRVLFTQSAKPK